jgi:alpha-ketoglutarate-dependent taurine dioxygenase
MLYRTTPIEPFGLLLEAVQQPCHLGEIPADELAALVERHKAVVLRGFSALSEEEFIGHARRFGPLLRWEFGELLNLRIVKQPPNHLFGSGRVEMHWDGAYLTEVPRFSLFQCLHADHEEGGGETLFTDAARMLELASPQQRAAWERAVVSYSTDKAAHYSGAVTVPLVSPHRGTGAPTVRFIEPFNEDNLEVNPVAVEVQGLPGEEQESFLRQVIDVMYDPRCMYRHRWHSGDFLMYDNHALLHGRAKMERNVARHLQRIHVLDGAPHDASRAPVFIGAKQSDIHV